VGAGHDHDGNGADPGDLLEDKMLIAHIRPMGIEEIAGNEDGGDPPSWGERQDHAERLSQLRPDRPAELGEEREGSAEVDIGGMEESDHAASGA
jgi:hypothetical protein